MILTPRINVEFFDDEGQHEYLLNGEPASSVTTILGAEGMSDYSYCTERDRNRGSAVHAIALLIGKRPPKGDSVDEIIANSPWDPDRTTPLLVGYGRGVAKFYLEQRIRPLLVEAPVGSLRYRIVGTLDLFGETPEGKRPLTDFKTGKAQPAAILQTNLYGMCLEETYGVKPDELWVVEVTADGDYRLLPPKPFGGAELSVAQSAVNCFHWRRRNKLI